VESDSIRASGSNTLVDIWIDGKLRAVSVSNDAIGAFLGFDLAARMSERDRCEFVRSNLPLVLAAAKNRLRDTGPHAEAVAIDGGHLPRSDGRSGDRRKTERRKSERRKVNLARAPGQPERRRNDRRQSDRRSRSGKSD
jgi:hypothetical protein